MTETALPYGWKPDPDGTGIVRIPESECPPEPRPGMWAKIDGLMQDTSKNGWFVEVLSEEPEDGVVKIKSQEETFMIKPTNLVELPGSEKTPRFLMKDDAK